MKSFSLYNQNTCLIEHVELAARVHQRMKGLLGCRMLPAGRAMHITPCSLIHTWFMRFPLDVVFLARDLSVTRTVHRLMPGRAAWGGRCAHSVIEMQSGWFSLELIRHGDQLRLVETETPAA